MVVLKKRKVHAMKSLGQRKKKKKITQGKAEREWHLLQVSSEHTQCRILTGLGRTVRCSRPKTFWAYVMDDTINPECPKRNNYQLRYLLTIP